MFAKPPDKHVVGSDMAGETLNSTRGRNPNVEPESGVRPGGQLNFHVLTPTWSRPTQPAETQLDDKPAIDWSHPHFGQWNDFEAAPHELRQ